MYVYRRVCMYIGVYVCISVRCFQNTKTIPTGLSDCHKMVVTVL